MSELNQLPMFFLGANAPGGFVSAFGKAYDPMDGWRVYIIKGGPGTGKSTLMKKAAALLAEKDDSVFLSPCTGDPWSLDAVTAENQKVMLLDGTAPHVVEPQYPGVCESLIDLGSCWDGEKLRANRRKILSVCRENKLLHERAARYITAAGSLLSDSCRIAGECADLEKAARFGEGLAGRLIPVKPGSKAAGRETVRFLSGITPKGLLFFRDTIGSCCDRVVILSDEYGACAHQILEAARQTALEAGWDVVTCPSPFAPEERLEHVLIPGLSLGFCTENRCLKLDRDDRRIHARRFTDLPALRRRKQRLTFNRRAAKELLQGASELLAEAKAVHDEMEKYYVEAMDFAKVNEMTARVLGQLEKLPDLR